MVYLVLVDPQEFFKQHRYDKSKNTGVWKGKLIRFFVNPKEVERAKNGTNII